MLAVRQGYRDSDLGYKLKLAQQERALALRIREITWTFDPLQSKNAHLNFDKLGVVSSSYKVDFYGPETSSVLHRNSTDRLWVRWPLASRRVQDRLQRKEHRTHALEALATLVPLVRFHAGGTPERTDLTANEVLTIFPPLCLTHTTVAHPSRCGSGVCAMRLSAVQCCRGFLASALAVLFVFPPTLFADTHLVTPADMQRELLAASQRREHNQKVV